MQHKLFATALGAFGLGALVSWAVTADIHEKRLVLERAGYDELLKDKTDHIFALKRQQESVSRQLSDTLRRVGDIELPKSENQQELDFVEPEEQVLDVLVERPEEDSEVPEGETEAETRTKLQSLVDEYTANPDAQAAFAEIISNAEEFDKVPPFILSRGDFAWDEEGEHYEKITVKYYERDRIVLDDDDDPMDVANTLGWRNLNQFGGVSEDPDVVFIRNRRMNTDFEVVREEGELPLHVKYGMGREEFNVNKAAGIIRLRPEDE